MISSSHYARQSERPLEGPELGIHGSRTRVAMVLTTGEVLANLRITSPTLDLQVTATLRTVELGRESNSDAEAGLPNVKSPNTQPK